MVLNPFVRQRGFTLLEMLIAMAIGASIAVIAYRALDGAILADEKVTAVVERVDEVDRVWQFMSNDLLYVVPRLWKNRNGSTKSAMIGVFGDRLSQSDVLVASEEDYLLQFVRGNRENLLSQTRSNLYMVGYRLTLDEGSEGNQKILWRDSWSPVDGSDEPKLQQRKLLSGINEMSFRYLPAAFTDLQDSNWLTGWPRGQVATNALPAAVEITIQTVALGKIVRIFSLSVKDP
jgi:general secretion pathway protein J